MTAYLMYAKIALAVAIIASIYLAGYHRGSASVQAEWDHDKGVRAIAENQAMITRLKFNEATMTRHKAENAILKNKYEREHAKNKSNASALSNQRLRVPDSFCNSATVSSTTDSSERSGSAVTGSRVLSAETSESFRQYALEADQVVAGCRAAQGFITNNGMAP